jgi:hypothetical protein
MEEVMTDELKEAFEELKNRPAMDYDIKNVKLADIQIKCILENAHTAGTMMQLLESPELGAETRILLEKDLARLIKKHRYGVSHLGQESVI